MRKKRRLTIEGEPISRARFEAILRRLEESVATFEPSGAVAGFRRSLERMRERLGPP